MCGLTTVGESESNRETARGASKPSAKGSAIVDRQAGVARTFSEVQMSRLRPGLAFRCLARITQTAMKNQDPGFHWDHRTREEDTVSFRLRARDCAASREEAPALPGGAHFQGLG